MPSSCSSWTTSAYISSRLRDIALWPYSGHDSRVWPFRITWRHRSRDRLIPIGHFLSVVLWSQASLSLTVSEIFNVECNAMVDMTLIRPLNKGQGHSFGTNRFLIYDFLFVLCVDIHLVGLIPPYRKCDAQFQCRLKFITLTSAITKNACMLVCLATLAILVLSHGTFTATVYRGIPWPWVSHSTILLGCLNFCSRTHRLGTIHNVTDRQTVTSDRQTTDATQHCSISATVLSTTVGWNGQVSCLNYKYLVYRLFS